MSIKLRNKKGVSFNMSSMSDLVFLLLIFFILVSTLVSPNAIDISLPTSESKTISPKGPVVAIDENNNYYFYSDPVDLSTLTAVLSVELNKADQRTAVELQADQTAQVAFVVNIYNIVNKYNELNDTKHKVLLKVSPPSK